MCCVVGKGSEDEGVILEEIAREKVEIQISYFFADYAICCCLYAPFRDTHEQGSVFFILLGEAVSFFTNGRECGVYFFHRDGTVSDVQILSATLLRHKTNT